MLKRPILSIDGDVVTVTNPYNKNCVFRVSVADIELVRNRVWNRSRRYPYIKRTAGHDKKDIYLHQVIMHPDAGQVVDFIDGDTTNLTRGNLRLCARRNDGKNMRLSVRNTSGYKGVTVCRGKYEARIVSDYKQHYLGCFATAEEAAEAYNRAALKYHKEFARLNVIPNAPRDAPPVRKPKPPKAAPSRAVGMKSGGRPRSRIDHSVSGRLRVYCPRRKKTSP